MSVLWAGLRGRWRGILYAESLLLSATGLSLGSTWLLGRALDVYVPAGDLPGVTRIAATYLGAVVAGGLLTWVARVRIEAEAQAALVALKERLFAHLVRHDLALHDSEGSGRLLSRTTSDVDALRPLWTEVVLAVPADLALFSGLLLILGLTAPNLALVVGASMPAWLLLILGYRRVSPARFMASRERAAALTAMITESLRALPLLRSYGRLDWLRARAETETARKRDADVSAGIAGVWFFNALFAVRSALLAALVWVGAVQVEAGTLTVGLLVVGLDYARKLVEPFIRIQFHLATVERARAGATRVDALLARVPTVRAPPNPRPWPGIGDGLRLEGVRFACLPGQPVLDGVDLVVPRGGSVALVGPTGGGKSTLVQLLFRFRDPDAGRLTVGGVDLRELDPAELRRHIGLVTQSVHLLPGTVAENLACPPDRAAALLAAAGLDRRLGPHTRVGDGGETLSRGEAQLLSVLRALAPDPELLVLDEATASMDPATEARVRALLGQRPERTLVWVAHRLRTVVDCDEIVLIAGGRLVERGAHAELLARGGRYADLWRASLAAEGAAA